MPANKYNRLGPVPDQRRLTFKWTTLFLFLLTAVLPAKTLGVESWGAKGIKTLGSRTILLRHGRIDPKQREDAFRLAEILSGPKKHMMIQFGHMPSHIDKAALEALGIRALRYIPNNTYWVSIDPTEPFALQDIQIAGGVQWAWIPAGDYKISEAIRRHKFPPNASYDEGTVEIRALFFKDVSESEALEAISSLESAVEVLGWGSNHVMALRTPISAISDIAALDGVEWVEAAERPKIPHNAVSSQRIHVDAVRAAPLSLDGAGVTVGVWDEGAVFDHQDFDTRLTVVDNVAVSDHSTHVAGTVGGSGSGNPNATGMAPGVLIHSYDWDCDLDYTGCGGSEMGQAMGNGIVISNHSYGTATGWEWNGSEWVDYGDEGFGLYSIYTSLWDQVVHDTDLLVFKSAGNDRNDCSCTGWWRWQTCWCDGPYDSISELGVGKNILTIGATTDSDAMTDFSSWGPVDDGRIKPDLCANGYGLVSTVPNDGYASYSGTSMSTPSAAGAAALLYQHFSDVAGHAPAAATLKALMIHGADDIGRPGPDYEFGWGLINAEQSADLISAGSWQSGSITGTASIQTYEVDVAVGSTELKVTLVWTDPPGSAAAAQALVNDLDLVLIDPDGTEHEPWILDPDNPEADATNGANHVDNVEQALVNEPMPGSWTVQISGYAVPLGPQDFALVGVWDCDDSDGDGVSDCEDNCPEDPDKTEPGLCGCGVPDSETDTDGDGVLDCNDGCPDDPTKTEPGDCGCGVSDTDTDGDGTPDCNDGCADDPDKTEPGDCGCGVSDTDTDGDGTPDCNDGCPEDPDKTEPGDCGCGVSDTDTDGDGTADCHDGCADDPDKTEPGDCGCGVADTDTDGDGVLDCVDNCPGEANPDQADSNGNGVGDACESVEMVIDNLDAGFSTESGWGNSTGTEGYYGSDYAYAAAGDGSKKATWRFDIVAGGQYDVSAWWTSRYSNRAPDAPYALYNNGVYLGTYRKDQRVDGGQFNLLDTCTLSSGTLDVVLSNDAASGYVIADAVQIAYVGGGVDLPPNGEIDNPEEALKTIPEGEWVEFLGTGSDPQGYTMTYLWDFENSGISPSTAEDPGWVRFDSPGTFTVTFTVTNALGLVDPTPATRTIQVGTPSEPLVIDNLDAGFSTESGWGSSTGTEGYYGSDYAYAAAGDGSKKATWRFDIVAGGQYDVSAWWTSRYSNRAPDAPYALYNNGVYLGTYRKDQRVDGGQFNLLDTCTLSSGTLDVVLSNDAASGYVIADAVQVVYRQ